jgi:hypothetical protein
MSVMTFATLTECGTTPLPCRHCGGEGRRWTSRYGGNDPDVWDAGPCEYCDGSGNQVCQYCNTGDPAIAKWRDNRSDHYVCQACHKEWVAEETAYLEE